MKLTKSFFGFVAVLCCLQDSGITATTNEIRQAEFYNNHRNLDCDRNEDCRIPDTKCVEGQCECPPNFIFNAAKTSCLKAADKYGDSCEETLQCSAYLQSGGTCTENICICAPGYHYLHGRCYKSSGLNEECRYDDDCYVNFDFEALSCSKNVCRCTEGFYQREYRTCRRASMEPDADCMIDLDCTFDEKAICDKHSKKCSDPKENESTIFPLDDYEAVRNLQHQVDNSVVRVEINCTSHEECEILGAAICDPAGKCICKRGYFKEGKMETCAPELGEKCLSKDPENPIKNSICREDRWNCQGANVPAINNRKCLKVARAYNTSCTTDEQCYIFGPDASCVGKRCLCNENSRYSEENMFCWVNRGLNETCERDLDCYQEGFDGGMTCYENTCTCPQDTHVNAAGTACIKDVAALGDLCTADDDCRSLANSMCVNKTCSCKTNHFEFAGKCVVGINGPCRKDEDCETEHSACHLAQCECFEGFVSPSVDLCVPVSSFGGSCRYATQCSAVVKNATCSWPEVPEVEKSTISGTDEIEGTCVCDEGHHYNYESCHRTRVLDEPCESRGECYVMSDPATVVCLKGICSCNWNQIPTNATFCRNGASTQMTLSTSIGLTMIVLRLVGVLF